MKHMDYGDRFEDGRYDEYLIALDVQKRLKHKDNKNNGKEGNINDEPNNDNAYFSNNHRGKYINRGGSIVITIVMIKLMVKIRRLNSMITTVISTTTIIVVVVDTITDVKKMMENLVKMKILLAVIKIMMDIKMMYVINIRIQAVVNLVIIVVTNMYKQEQHQKPFTMKKMK